MSDSGAARNAASATGVGAPATLAQGALYFELDSGGTIVVGEWIGTATPSAPLKLLDTTDVASYGTIGTRPSAATAGDRAFYTATDQTGLPIYQVQSGVWVPVGVADLTLVDRDLGQPGIVGPIARGWRSASFTWVASTAWGYRIRPSRNMSILTASAAVLTSSTDPIDAAIYDASTGNKVVSLGGSGLFVNALGKRTKALVASLSKGIDYYVVTSIGTITTAPITGGFDTGVTEFGGLLDPAASGACTVSGTSGKAETFKVSALADYHLPSTIAAIGTPVTTSTGPILGLREF